MPTSLSINNNLPDQSASSVIRQAKQIHSSIQVIASASELEAFFGDPDDPSVIAEVHVLGLPDTLTFVTMAIISYTSYLSPSSHQRLGQLK
jgi:hypothetical protein